MRLRPALVLAAPVGVLGGHAIGYLAAPGPAGAAAVHHGYLAFVLAVALPLAVAAMGWAAAGGARSAASRPVALGPLVVAQWALFSGQEAIEHTLAGHGPAAALHSPALWCGLVAQVLTAVAIVAVLRASAVTGSRLLATPGGDGSAFALRRVPWRPARPPWPTSPVLAAGSPARAPPAGRFA